MPTGNLHIRARCASLAIAVAALAGWFTLPGARGGETAPAVAATPEGIEYFERHVRPLFAQNCLKCHGEKQQGGLRLDSRTPAMDGGDSGPAIAAGNPQASLLVQALHYKDEIKMPPEGKLPPEAILAIENWIKIGAPWPAETASAAPPHAAEAWKTHWALQPVTKPALLKVARGAWPRSPVDFFVLSKLEEQGLSPSEAASRRILIRRATFDLTGLPAEAAEIEAFAADQSPGAFDRVIERLLASPHYGERWGRHWLDVARYADTKGYLFTQDRNYPNAYRYRDWVVRALNEDLPYDQFLIQQIAADRLAPPDAPNLAAMGFLTVGRRFLGNPHDIIDDRLDVLTRGTMALTVTCARCHDHKYDPIPTKDYYALYGVLASSVEPAQPADLMTLADAERPVVPHVFVRGNPGNRGESVPRQFLGVLAGENRQPFGSGSGRLELARAIASRDNPLTARVIVNRVWLHYFENPLVRTPSDFGLRSEPPSHPELLDYLAASLIEHQWSLKDLHRLILKSATYQQASADRVECRKVDAENRYLWRMNRKRLDFESLRDGLLAAAGQLDRSLGGPAVELTKAPWSRRRALYGLVDRQNLPSMFRTFDFASPDTHSPGRFTTTVPQQALYMMNSPFLAEMVRSLANRQDFAGTSEPRERIERMYRLGLGRPPGTQEVELGLAFLAEEEARDERTPVTGSPQPPPEPSAQQPPPRLSAWERYVQVVLLSNEFMFID